VQFALARGAVWAEGGAERGGAPFRRAQHNYYIDCVSAQCTKTIKTTVSLSLYISRLYSSHLHEEQFGQRGERSAGERHSDVRSTTIKSTMYQHNALILLKLLFLDLSIHGVRTVALARGAV